MKIKSTSIMPNMAELLQVCDDKGHVLFHLLVSEAGITFTDYTNRPCAKIMVGDKGVPMAIPLGEDGQPSFSLALPINEDTEPRPFQNLLSPALLNRLSTALKTRKRPVRN